MIKIDYINLKCGICESEFEEGDDVVVCPECGTPMHRKCYCEAGSCPNEKLHASGYVFEGFEEIKKSAQGKDISAGEVKNNDEILCPICGESNKKGSSFCNRCGINLAQADNSVFQPQIPGMMTAALDPLAGVPADTQFEEDVTASDVACYVRVNTQYYVGAFNRIKKKSNKFNFSAAIFSGIWMLYRKQYKLGSIICALDLLIFALQYYLTCSFSLPLMNEIMDKLQISAGPSGLSLEQYSKIGEYIYTLPIEQQLLFLTPYIALFLFLVLAIFMGIFGNKLYYKHCIGKIKEIKAKAVKENYPKNSVPLILNSAGGVNFIVALIFFGIYFISLFV